MRHTLRISVLLLVGGFVVLVAGCGGSNSSAPPTTSSTGSFASAKNCLELARLTKFARAASLTGGGRGVSRESEPHNLQALADAAPSDIKRDFKTLASAVSRYLQVAAGYKMRPLPPGAMFIMAARSLDAPRLKAAERHLNAWRERNCK